MKGRQSSAASASGDQSLPAGVSSSRSASRISGASRAQPFTQLLSGLSVNRPRGLQRIDWDPRTRTCRSVWANREVSLPNGIPSLSASTGQIFGIGSRTLNGVDTWTLESIDFATGASRYHVASTPYPTDNSFYAATTIGPGNSVWTGTFGGVTRFQDCVASQTCGRRALSPLQQLPLSSLAAGR